MSINKNLGLIVSNEFDFSTNQVIDWLLHYGIDFVRINNNDSIIIEKVDFSAANAPEVVFRINNTKMVCSSEINFFWYRRGGIQYDNIIKKGVENALTKNKKRIVSGIAFEQNKVIEFLIFLLESKNKLGCKSLSDNNKLIHLDIAKKVGLNIPKTSLISTKSDIEHFKKKHNLSEVITKCIDDGFSIKDEKNVFGNYTSIVSRNMFRTIPQRFPISLIQEKIEKKWEIRSFYLNSKFYSMAIFSQTDPQTKIDFRKYNDDNPNRFVPFILPKTIEAKLDKFMKISKLDTGSIDLAYTIKDDFVFFEVNPVGQFGMVSNNCNYNLEKEIAKLFYR